jgi:hypothetical protein
MARHVLGDAAVLNSTLAYALGLRALAARQNLHQAVSQSLTWSYENIPIEGIIQ